MECFNSMDNFDETDTYHYLDDNLGDQEEYLPWKLCNASATFTLIEPVMVEPLDYYSTRESSKTMNNITNIILSTTLTYLRT